MRTVTLTLSESQIVEAVRQLSPEGKRAVLKALVPDLDPLEALVAYGSGRVRALCAERGLDWDRRSEDERERLVEEARASLSGSMWGVLFQS